MTADKELRRAASWAEALDDCQRELDALRAATPPVEGLTIEALAGALYDTDPPESWMRTGTDEYRKRAAAMLDILAATPPADWLDEELLARALHLACQPTEPCRLPAGVEDAVYAALAPEQPE